ncbi:hypothetical protein [Anaerosinus massiliensis]|uniref:hypothetical protein n=1 Tax=Massilibacillus massiliensis TaxID=1806837 RepID=UPI000DA61F6E|nr:hypothetical protein [Massilibacillus massiliensis]
MFFNISVSKTIKYFEEVDDITAMNVRLSMKYFGWNSKDYIDASGVEDRYVYRIEFMRDDQQGGFFKAQTNDVGKINSITKECALKALKSYLDKGCS